MSLEIFVPKLWCIVDTCLLISCSLDDEHTEHEGPRGKKGGPYKAYYRSLSAPKVKMNGIMHVYIYSCI